MKPLRVAVVGVGHLGRIHARILAGLEHVDLVGVVDPVEANREQAALEYRCRPFADHQQLAGQIDAAIVATPTASHHAVALDLLRGGIHLLVEKPLSATLAQAEELVEAARRQAVQLQVGHIERFNPAFAAAWPHLHEPKYIEAVRTSGFTFRSTDIGVVLDLMIHDIDLVLSLTRSPVQGVQALGISVLGRHEDVAHARLVFENGCVATLNASRISQVATRRMQIWSRRCFAGLDLAARVATLVRPSETLLRRELDIEQLLPAEKARWKETLLAEHLPVERIEPEPCDALTAELLDFADSIRSGRAPRVPGEQGRDAVAVAQQVLAKIQTHAWDGTSDGPVGPLAAPAPRIIRGPHWGRQPAHPAAEQREAG